MTTDSNLDSDEAKAFVFDILAGVGGLIGVGYAGYELEIFVGTVHTLPSIAIVSGVVLGTSSVAIMETEWFQVLFKEPIVGTVAATAMMCIVAGIVWTISQAGLAQAIYTLLGVIVAALVTRIYVFVSRREGSEETAQ